MSIVLHLLKPFSTNAMYRSYVGHGRAQTIKSKAYRDWQARAIGLITTQKWQPVTGAFSLRIVVPRDNRFDLDNVSKSAIDTLRHAGVIVDDSPKYLRSLSIEIGGDEHTKIIITPLETADALD